MTAVAGKVGRTVTRVVGPAVRERVPEYRADLGKSSRERDHFIRQHTSPALGVGKLFAQFAPSHLIGVAIDGFVFGHHRQHEPRGSKHASRLLLKVATPESTLEPETPLDDGL